jgi:hypothetical protein
MRLPIGGHLNNKDRKEAHRSILVVASILAKLEGAFRVLGLSTADLSRARDEIEDLNRLIHKPKRKEAA